MHVLTNPRAFKPERSRPLFLGLGNFDGVHLGHQALFARVLSEAKTKRGHAALLTFQGHPQSVLHPDKKTQLLVSDEQKLFLFSRAGFDFCLRLPFTESFSKLAPEAFVTEVLCRQLKVREICMGYNARFGHRRKGDAPLMAYLGRKWGFDFSATMPVRVGGEIVSSSRIRRLVAEGQLAQARECLGRPFSLWGEVIRGDGRGRMLGFPTANLKLESHILPPAGVYPAWARTVKMRQKPAGRSWKEIKFEAGQWQRAVVNIGTRPTFGSSSPLTVEAHLIDFKGVAIYGQTLELVLGAVLRGERAFQGPEMLKAQIQKDIRQACQGLPGLKKSFTRPYL